MSTEATAPSQHGIGDFEPTDSIKGEYLSGIVRLAGFWEADDSCESLKPVGFCEAGHVQLGGAEPCSSRTCPHHWYRWRKKAAANMVARLAAYRYTQERRGRRLLHLVASPDQDQRWTVKRFWDHRAPSYEVAEEIGSRGGVAIPHPYGVSDHGNDLFETVTEYGDWEGESGKWRFLRDSSESWEEMKPLIDVHPHFHHLAAVEDFDTDAIPDDWVVKNVRSLAPFFLDPEAVPEYYRVGDDGTIRDGETVVQESFEDMAKLSMYLLSHAAVQPETGDLGMKQTVTYYGEVNTINPEEALSAEDWEEIQRWAEEAVGVEPDLEDDEVSLGDVCNRDGCEAEAHGLEDFDDWIADPSNVEALEYDQALEMMGLKAFLSRGVSPGASSSGDRPPPGGFDRSPEPSGDLDRADQEAWIEWLRRLGRTELRRSPFYRIEQPA